MLESAAIFIGLVGVFMAWRAGRRARYLEERLDSTNNRYFTLLNHVRELQESTQQQFAALQVEMKRQAGLLKFEPQMTIGEIYAMHPRAADVLAGFHLGGCSSCAVSPDRTLASAAQQHHLNLDLLLGALRQLADGASGGTQRPQNGARVADPDLRIIA